MDKTRIITDHNVPEKSKAHILAEIVEYMARSVVIKTILRQTTGSVRVLSFDSGESVPEETSPFDMYAQIIDGKAELVIGNVSYFLETGQAIIIPAHQSNFVRPNYRFKMILTVIKSGYG